MNWFEFLRWRSGYQPQTKAPKPARLRDFISEAQQITPSGNQDRLQKMQDESLRRIMKERDEMGLNRPGLPEMRSYEPTKRENLNVNLQKMGVPQATATRMAGTNPAISPLGGMLDLMPFVGTALGTEEAGRAAQRGDYVTAGLAGAGSVLDMIPGGAAVAKPVMRGLKALRRVPTEPVRMLPAPTPRAASTVASYNPATNVINLPDETLPRVELDQLVDITDMEPDEVDLSAIQFGNGDAPAGELNLPQPVQPDQITEADMEAALRELAAQNGIPQREEIATPPQNLVDLIEAHTDTGPRAPEQDAVDKLNKALFGPDTDFLPEYPAPGKMKVADIMGDDDLMYSPSHLAFGQGQRGKGTPAEWRKEIIKKGGKENELDWMGFDEYFKGKKSVTRDEMHEFFNTRERPYEMVVNDTASGTTGAQKSGEELREEWIDTRLAGEIEFQRDDALPTMLDENYTQLGDADIDEATELAEYNGIDISDEAAFNEWFAENRDRYLIRDGYGSSSPRNTQLLDQEDAIEAVYGDPEQAARESLENQVRYDMDEDEIRADLGYDDWGEAFDPGLTESSDYTPPGMEDYAERLMTQPIDARRMALPGTPRLQDVPTHHAYNDDPHIMHMRTGTYRNADDGGSVFYDAEHQSDWAQRVTGKRGRGLKTIEDERPLARAGQAKIEADEEVAFLSDLAESQSPYTDRQLDSARELRRLDPSEETWRAYAGVRLPGEDGATNPEMSLGTFGEQYLRDHYMGPSVEGRTRPGGGFDPRPYYPSPGRSWYPQWAEGNSMGVRTINGPTVRSLAVEHAMRNQPLPRDGLPGLVNPPEVQDYGMTLGRDLQVNIARSRSAADDVASLKKDFYDDKRLPAGPYIKKTEDWTRQGLRQALNDAIMGGHDYLAVNPGSEPLTAAVGGGGMTGSANPKVMEYYRGTVRKQLSKLAKSYGSDLDEIAVDIGGDRYAMPAIKLTSEFVKKVNELGIPLFTVGGAAILGATSQQEAEAIVAQQQGRT